MRETHLKTHTLVIRRNREGSKTLHRPSSEGVRRGGTAEELQHGSKRREWRTEAYRQRHRKAETQNRKAQSR